MSTEKHVSGCEKRRKTMDESVQEQINKEKEHWVNVLQRINSIVKFIVERKLKFYGEEDELYTENNGAFFSLSKMFAVFDPIMQEHIQRVQEHETRYHDLGHQIQNEFITLLAGEIKSTILKRIKEAKYFSVILDGSLDVSGERQISLVLRCVDVSSTPVKVEELYLDFLKREGTLRHGLFRELTDVIRTLELDIGDVRGQVYGNGFNMRREHKDVEKRLLEMNPRAFYMPRGCHSLNLVFWDIADSCSEGLNVFGTIGLLYSFFSSSTYEWDIFKDNVQGFTEKPLSQTCWVGHLEYVKALRFQAPQITDALIHIVDTCRDHGTRHTANSLVDGLENFEFLFGLIIWYDILFAVDEVSKKFETKDMHMGFAIDQLNKLVSFFETYRETGFQSAMITAKEVAANMHIDPVFPKRKVQFKGNVDDDTTQSAEESFRVGYFIYIVDHACSSLQYMIEQFQAFEETFGFLFDLKKLSSADDDTLKSCCAKLEDFLKHDMLSDIDGSNLFSELKALREGLPRDIKNAIEVLNYINSMDCGFPNAWVAYRVLLTIPITAASTESGCSKLELIESYLQSKMSEESLDGLAMLSIENDVFEKIDCESLISNFAAQKARSMILQ